MIKASINILAFFIMFIPTKVLSNKSFFFEGKQLNFVIGEWQGELFYINTDQNPKINDFIEVCVIGALTLIDEDSYDLVFLGSILKLYQDLENTKIFAKNSIKFLKSQGEVRVCEKEEAEKLILNPRAIVTFK